MPKAILNIFVPNLQRFEKNTSFLFLLIPSDIYSVDGDLVLFLLQ